MAGTSIRIVTEKLSDGSEVFNVVILFPRGGRVTFEMDSERSACDLGFQLGEVFNPGTQGIPAFGRENGIIDVCVDSDDPATV